MEHLDDLHINNISLHYILLHKPGGRGGQMARLCAGGGSKEYLVFSQINIIRVFSQSPHLFLHFFFSFFRGKRDINYSLTLQPCILLLQLQLKVKSLNFFLFFSPQESWEFMLDCISCNVKRLLYCFLSALVIWGHIPQ